MAKLPTIKRLSIEDFQSQKAWISRLISPINEFIVSVVSSFNNNLTFTENISAQVKTVRVKTAATVTTGTGTLPNYVELLETVNFQSTMKDKPAAVWVGAVAEVAGNPGPIFYATQVQWNYRDGQIYISHVSGLGVSKTYDLVLIAVTG
jgi:hypothetical protein